MILAILTRAILPRWMLAVVVAGVSVAWSGTAAAQQVRGTVVDQTGLVLPGVTIQLMDGSKLVANLTTRDDGTFELPAGLAGSTVIASLSGFEARSIARGQASRIVLALAHTSEVTNVVAPEFAEASPTGSLLGTGLSADTLARMPSSHLKARESLPLLPGVVRGPDGLIQLGGARAYQTPLLLDGFNVTDPATGISSLNLPFEAVKGIQVLRDPMGVTYGRLMGGLVEVTSKPGDGPFKAGVQGFVPRPRFATPGFGRLEGIFPRVYAGGTRGRLRYFGTVEYDFERIPVPEVTKGAGPNLVQESAIAFGRIDLQVNAHNALVVEALAFPNNNKGLGLSARRDYAATSNLHERDLFAGVTLRHVFSTPGVLTFKIGMLRHDTLLAPNGSGTSDLSPAGWSGNWFSALNRQSSRYSVTATWERVAATSHGSHALTIAGGVSARRLVGTIAEAPVRVRNAADQLVRTVDFGAPTLLAVRDVPADASIRDIWSFGQRVQLDAGVRVDYDRVYGPVAPSARGGIRYALDDSGFTVLKAGIGSFVGNMPLSIAAFGAYPARVDRRIDGPTGEIVLERLYRPVLDGLVLPQARAVTLQLERQIRPGLDAQIGVTDRRSRRLATLDVPLTSGPTALRSTGVSKYRELQIGGRWTWAKQQQLFVSYVWSSSEGELNDFTTVFQGFDAALLQPGGRSRLPADARHRWLAWSTVNLPQKIVVSPVFEWHSGFPFSTLTEHNRYNGTPNDAAFPPFMATDLVVYRTFTLRQRSADLGIQLFNATNHFNPRDVYAVAGSPQFRTLTNSVGPVLRGFMLLKW